MLKGFKDFILRGNVIELAVGFVMGMAFAAVVAQFTASFLDPLIRVITGGQEAAGTFTIRGQVFDWAAFVNAVILFVLTAAAIYFFVVLPVNKLAQRRGAVAPEEISDEARLLTEIRDLLGGQTYGGDYRSRH